MHPTGYLYNKHSYSITHVITHKITLITFPNSMTYYYVKKERGHQLGLLSYVMLAKQ